MTDGVPLLPKRGLDSLDRPGTAGCDDHAAQLSGLLEISRIGITARPTTLPDCFVELRDRRFRMGLPSEFLALFGHREAHR